MTAEPYYADGSVTLLLGDCLDVLAGMDAASVDAVVTDPALRPRVHGQSVGRVTTRTRVG
jgi:predicted methyltransferase